jgi:uncharacterized membrane protein YfhO
MHSPNLEMYLGYQTVGGYTPLYLYRYHEYIRKYPARTPVENFSYFYYGRAKHDNTILMDLFNVKYEILYNEKKYKFRTSCLPRVFIVPRYQTYPEEDILDRLVSDQFNPLECILFAEEDLPKPPVFVPKIQDFQQDAQILSYSPDEIILSTECSAPGLLFLSEVFYPGWEAYIDGERVSLMRGNYLFRVVVHPEGKHKVRLVFRPLSIRLGIAVSLLAVFCLGAAASRRLIIASKRDHPPSQY